VNSLERCKCVVCRPALPMFGVVFREVGGAMIGAMLDLAACFRVGESRARHDCFAALPFAKNRIASIMVSHASFCAAGRPLCRALCPPHGPTHRGAYVASLEIVA